MQCPLCSRTNQEGNNFCVACGTQLVTHCPACGHRGESGWEYCAACGAPHARSAAIRRGGADHLHPGSARRGDRRLEALSFSGGRKLVTVLFADVVGSSALLGDDPEIGHQKVDRALAVMLEAIHDARGFVARIQGDGVMVLFGAPLAQEHHALRACDAALAIQRGIERPRWRGAPGPGRPQFRRGRGAHHPQRPVGRLRRGRANRAPRQPHGADGRARRHPADRQHAEARPGLRRRGAARAPRNRGLHGQGAGLRPARAPSGPDALGGSARDPDAVGFRRPGTRARPARRGAGGGARRPGSSRPHPGRCGRWQVQAGLRVPQDAGERRG